MEREKRLVQMILLSLFKQFVDILKLSQASVLYCGVDFVKPGHGFLAAPYICFYEIAQASVIMFWHYKFRILGIDQVMTYDIVKQPQFVLAVISNCSTGHSRSFFYVGYADTFVTLHKKKLKSHSVQMLFSVLKISLLNLHQLVAIICFVPDKASYVVCGIIRCYTSSVLM